MIFVLGRVYLVEAKRTQVELAEFDGAWCFFEESRMRWFLFEHKQGTGAARDLRKKTKHFRGTLTIESASAIVTGHASVAIVEWNADIAAE